MLEIKAEEQHQPTQSEILGALRELIYTKVDEEVTPEGYFETEICEFGDSAR